MSAPAGITRSAFILRGAFAVGAAYGAGAVAPFVSAALGATATGDLPVLEFALGLEQLESAFYTMALQKAGLTGDAHTLATEFGAHEAEHVKALDGFISQLGGTSPAPPKVKFGLTGPSSFLKLAVTLEDVGVGAYNGAATLLKTPDLTAALGSIVNVEARHSGALRMLAGQDPAPQPFEKPLTRAQVDALVRPFKQ